MSQLPAGAPYLRPGVNGVELLLQEPSRRAQYQAPERDLQPPGIQRIGGSGGYLELTRLS